jgi:hypothetical protein
MVLALLIFKPVYYYATHFNEDNGMELCEDSSEEPLQEEDDDCFDVNDFYYLSTFNFSINDVTSYIKKSKKRYNRQFIEVYVDVLIPPPKFI